MAIQKLFGISPDIRYLNELREVLCDRKWLEKFSEKSLAEFAVYYMYRDIAKSKSDRLKINQSGLRYDITIIPPKMFGIEYPKTLGHMHDLMPNTTLSYPEIYQVLDGEACFLQPKFDKTKNNVTEIWAFLAKKGDIVITPPNCGHITINIGKMPLKMADWISQKAKSDYSIFKNKKGGPYFVIKPFVALAKEGKHKKNRKIKWIKNKNYSSVAEIKFGRPINPLILGLKKNEDIYNLINNPAKMDFLKNPQNHLDFLKTIV